ncbi:hypothetical protein CBOM_01240 [Ceraceosorus bombacis]|uniref:Uncharacterized protein n=1 Tax=Ceraceosorus bombacis TaxID=401625 RepID=A0A0P1BBZ0_9BASI|nr:hypothetical protein CBOM_01240 [Ceraceosorus bombacis]
MAFLMMILLWALLYLLAFAHQKLTALTLEISRLRDQAQENADEYQRLGKAGQQAALDRFWARLEDIAGKTCGAPEELLSEMRNNPLNTINKYDQACERSMEFWQCGENALELVDNVALQFEQIWNEWLGDAMDTADDQHHAGLELCRPGYNTHEFRTAMAGVLAGLRPTSFQESGL